VAESRPAGHNADGSSPLPIVGTAILFVALMAAAFVFRRRHV
jgi:hypothetical protein